MRVEPVVRRIVKNLHIKKDFVGKHLQGWLLYSDILYIINLCPPSPKKKNK